MGRRCTVPGALALGRDGAGAGLGRLVGLGVVGLGVVGLMGTKKPRYLSAVGLLLWLESPACASRFEPSVSAF